MFDNPKKELARLQMELLAVEQPPQPEEEEDSTLELEELKSLLGEEEWEEDERDPLVQDYLPEEELLSTEPEAPVEKKKGPDKGFLFALVVEIVGILALILWWFL